MLFFGIPLYICGRAPGQTTIFVAVHPEYLHQLSIRAGVSSRQASEAISSYKKGRQVLDGQPIGESFALCTLREPAALSWQKLGGTG